MKKPIIDLNMHALPYIDMYIVDVFESLDMLQIAYDNGVRDIFCPFHSHKPLSIFDCEEMDYKGELYMEAFIQFINFINGIYPYRFPGLSLYPCCEVHCGLRWIDEVLEYLRTGNFPSLFFTRYVLIALCSSITPEDTLQIINQLIADNWIPIIAHPEFYPLICNDNFIEKLISLGVKFQVNLYSLEEDLRIEVRDRARNLLNKKYVHFIGSYAHSFEWKPPRYEKGLKYLSENCDEKYFDEICFLNAKNIIEEGKRIWAEKHS